MLFRTIICYSGQLYVTLVSNFNSTMFSGYHSRSKRRYNLSHNRDDALGKF